MSKQKSLGISHPVGVLHEIRWIEICPWLILVRSLRVALLVRVLFLAYLGVLLTQIGWAVLGSLSAENPVELQRFTDTVPQLPHWESLSHPNTYTEYRNNPLFRAWNLLSQPLTEMNDPTITWRTAFILISSACWAIAIWSIFGGAIARISAMQLTRGETLGLVSALKSATTVFLGTAGAPLIALLGAAALSIPLLFAGLLIRLDFMAMLTGLAWIFVLTWGAMCAVVLIGLLFGWPLMWATLAIERSDAFDAISRCYAYVYQRPLQLFFYLMVAGLLGCFGETAVHYFAIASVNLADWAISWGSGSQRAADMILMASEENDSVTGMAATGAQAMHFWKQTWLGIAASYPVAYLWSTFVGIYLLLRRHVDSTEMDEITLTQQDPFQGLPELQKNEIGLPEVKEGSN